MIGHRHGPFEPDVVVPAQFFATLRRHAPHKRGEHRLLVALLEDAVERFQKHVLTGNRRFAEAEQWIMGEGESSALGHEDHDPGFSFEYVCGVLGFEPAYLRRGLQRWRAERLLQRR
jgi:hypothetical protein